MTPRRSPDVRLLLPAATAWATAWWACAASARVVAVVASAALALGVLVGLAGHRRRARRGPAVAVLPVVALALAACAATVGAAAAWQSLRESGPLPGWVRQGAVVDLVGRAAGDAHRLAPGPFGARERYAVRVDVAAARGRGLETSTSVPVLVLAGPGWEGVTAGRPVTFTGRLRVAEAGDDVVALVSAIGRPSSVGEGSWAWRIADRVREGLREACSGLDPDAGGLLPSLVVGDTSRLPPALEDDLRTAGLTHLTAVSGANVAIVVGCALWATAAAGAPRAVRWAVAGAALVGFVVLARPTASVLRAGAMGAVALVGLAGARRPQGVPVLCSATVALLVVDPWLARSPGFALSVVATASLLLLAPAWTDRLARWMPRPLALALAAPAAAQAACGPVVVLLDPAVSTVAVPANLLADPAVAPATVLGVVAAVLSLVWPSGAELVATAGGWATGWIALVAHRAAAVPGARLPWLPGVAGAVSLLVLTAAGVALSLARGRRPAGTVPSVRLAAHPSAHPSTAPAVHPFAGRWPSRRAVLALVVAGLVGWVVAPRLPAPVGGGGGGAAGGGDWAVALCDVGQGDATLLRSGSDRAVLVDAGPDPEAVDRCLHRLGVVHLDLVVLSHAHADHVLGLPGVLRGRTVDGLLVSPLPEPDENADRVQRWAAGAGVPVGVGLAGGAGRTAADGRSVSWRLLAPATAPPGQGPPGQGPPGQVPRGAGTRGSPVPRADDGGAEDAEGTEINESSVVLAAEVAAPSGTLRVVVLGDLETSGQARLLATHGGDPLLAGADVVKVAHHGSAKQSARLYAAIGARVALVGVGADNDYGHPAPSALSMLQRVGATVLRSDVHGDVLLTPAPDGAIGVVTQRG